MPNSCLGLVLLVGLLPAQQPAVGVQRPIGLVTPALIEAPKAQPREALPSEVQPRVPSAARSIDGNPSETEAPESPAVEVSLPAPTPPSPTESSLAVPEPSMLLAVGGGLVLLALAKRRRRGGRSTPLL